VRDIGGLAIAGRSRACLAVVLMSAAITSGWAVLLHPMVERLLDALPALVVWHRLALAAWQFWLYAAKMARAHETPSCCRSRSRRSGSASTRSSWCAVLSKLIVTLRDIARLVRAMTALAIGALASAHCSS